MIDTQGKLWGRINIIDLSLMIIVVAALSGFAYIFMGQSPLEQKIQATGEASVTIAIRGARVQDATIFKVNEKVFLTIRNQRYEPVVISAIDMMPRKTVFLNSKDQPVIIEDISSPEIKDIDITFTHGAEVTDEGVIMGGHHMKVGNSVELDAFGYRFNGSIMKVDFKNQ